MTERHDATDQDFQAQEQRCRRLAKRQGLALCKSRVRTPEDPSWCMYAIADPYRNTYVAGIVGSRFAMNLDEAEAYLREEAQS